MSTFDKDFETEWENKTFTPVTTQKTENANSMDVDVSPASRSIIYLPWATNIKLPDGKYYCPACNKTFAKDSVWTAHVNSPKHKKAQEKYDKLMKDICCLQVKISKYVKILSL